MSEEHTADPLCILWAVSSAVLNWYIFIDNLDFDYMFKGPYGS